MNCTYCDLPLTDEEIADPDRDECGDVLCDECYCSKYHGTCGRCGECYDTQRWEPVAFVAPEPVPADIGDDMPPGYYRVVGYPVYASDMFSAWIERNHVRYVAAPDSDLWWSSAACEWLCEDCTAKLPLFCALIERAG